MANNFRKYVFFIRKYTYAALCCLYLFSVGFLFAKYRSLIWIICSYFNFGCIPKSRFSEVISTDQPIQILEPIASDGNVSLYELIAVNALIKSYNSNSLFEIGTFDGRTTLNMAVNSPQESQIFTLDLPKGQMFDTNLDLAPTERRYINKETSGLRFMGKSEAGKIVQLYGDSASFDFAPYYNAMDFIFIDGSHAYEYVLNDSINAFKMVKEHGIIVWHDYTAWEGVTKALNELWFGDTMFKNIKHIEGTTLVYLIK